LVLQERFWVVAIESKETSFSLGLAMPQLLAYLLTNPNPERPVYGMVTNGELFSFAKVQKGATPQYDISSTFSLLARGNELYSVLQILQRMGEVALQDNNIVSN
ncbi:MAG: type I restriction endonuclease subunit R, partial [Spirulinaceae cyanobacterium]